MLFYSHVNEDNAVERNALLRQQPDTLVGITGSGERLMALLDVPSLRQVIAIDTNAEAQHLFALKLAALNVLSVTDYLAFIGHTVLRPDLRRDQLQRIEPHLTDETRQYWSHRRAVIERGVVNAGHFETYLARLRPLVRLLLGPHFGECFTKPVTEIVRFPHRRWQALMKIFSQTWVYSLSGNIDIAFTAPDCDSQRIAGALQETLDQHTCAESFMFHLIFTGHLRNMSSTTVPPSLQPLLLERIQNRLRNDDLRIQLVTDDVCQYLRQCPIVGENVFLSLSDLLSFVPAEELLDVLTSVKVQHMDVDVQGIVRSFIRHDFKPDDIDRFSRLAALQDVSIQERTRMYKAYYFSL
jgi:S-adenosylmethionine:diacylglycerol 3-amino-3-carboxypropyl transferase